VGLGTLQVQVADRASATDVATVTIHVDKVPHPPRWRQNPIRMNTASEDTVYTFRLSDYAVDDDSLPLHFRKVSGPDWMTVSDDGVLTGSPSKPDIGTQTAVFEASDGTLTAETSGIVQVIHVNHAPVIGQIPPFNIKERQIVKGALSQYVSDPDGDKLNYVLVNAESWMTLSPTGDLVMSPQYAQVGTHGFAFRVDDGQLVTQGNIQIVVARDPRPPIWLQDPIRLQAKTNQLTSGDVSTIARDLDGIPLTFSKKDGKSWLSVGRTGALTGTPGSSDSGDNLFTLTACNDKLCADARLIVSVQPGTTVDTVQVDTVVPGAAAETLWVLDNSTSTKQAVESLKAQIHLYFEDLAGAQVHDTGLLLSSDVRKWEGLPIRNNNQGPLLMQWSDSNRASDFGARVDYAFSDGSCGNCDNSPIWSMHLFYNRLPQIAEIYQKHYFMSSVAGDALIMTSQREHFPGYAKSDAQYDRYTAADYARDFSGVNSTAGKPFRVSVLAPECPALHDGDPSNGAPADAYYELAAHTGGAYYSNGCNYNMPTVLHDFAKKVIFRAELNAKSRIKLSKRPVEVSTMKVNVGGTDLTGNSGGAADQWTFDPPTNSVLIRWDRVAPDKVKPGDAITVTYQAS
jgi:hypothetical protein